MAPLVAQASGGNHFVNIRRANASDCSALTALMHESSAYQGAYEAILLNYSVSPEQVASSHVYAAVEEEVIQGFYSLVVADDEGELDLFFVRDAAQGQRIGAALFRHMKSLAISLGIGIVKIVSHPPAEGFYRNMGARPVGTQPPSGRVSWPRPILLLHLQNAA